VRVLVLSNHFPQPENQRLGMWGLLQAKALSRGGDDVRVFAPVVAVPRPVSRLPGGHRLLAAARRWATCPPTHRWDGLEVSYPRWPLPHVGPHYGWFYRHPRQEAQLGWLSIRSRLLREVEEFAPDVIYAHGTGLCGYLAMKVKERTGISFVTVDHDFGEIADCAHHPARLEHYRRVAAEASASLADCRRIARDTGRLLLTPRAVALNTAADPPPDDLAPPDAPGNGRVVVLSAGSFIRRKGFPELVEAFARGTATAPDTVMRVAGDGPLLPDVVRTIDRAGLSKRVELLGFIPHRQFLGEMNRCDVFALIGWDEPCATVYMEAMAAGKPVICCSDGGITDVLENGRHGLTVPPRDVDAAATAIAQLIESAEERRRLGQEARRLHRSKLTWDANATALHRVLAGAAQQR